MVWKQGLRHRELTQLLVPRTPALQAHPSLGPTRVCPPPWPGCWALGAHCTQSPIASSHCGRAIRAHPRSSAPHRASALPGGTWPWAPPEPTCRMDQGPASRGQLQVPGVDGKTRASLTGLSPEACGVARHTLRPPAPTPRCPTQLPGKAPSLSIRKRRTWR